MLICRLDMTATPINQLILTIITYTGHAQESEFHHRISSIYEMYHILYTMQHVIGSQETFPNSKLMSRFITSHIILMKWQKTLVWSKVLQTKLVDTM
ncbi:hypothetical protein H671_7g17516 [Cricetulus griseus]|nr:hypothetical protein H671_7g17516 [Cricetulus griseus]